MVWDGLVQGRDSLRCPRSVKIANHACPCVTRRTLNILRRAASRLVQSALVLLGVYSVTFVMVVAVPGNPFPRPGARALPPAVESALRQRYGMQSNPRFYAA